MNCMFIFFCNRIGILFLQYCNNWSLYAQFFINSLYDVYSLDDKKQYFPLIRIHDNKLAEIVAMIVLCITECLIFWEYLTNDTNRSNI